MGKPGFLQAFWHLLLYFQFFRSFLLALSGEEASFSIEGFYKGFIKLCVVVEGLENTPCKIHQSMDLMVEFLVELLGFLFEP